MPIWNVEVTGEWLVEGIEAEDEYDAEMLAIDCIYNVDPEYTTCWAVKVREDDNEESESESDSTI